MPAAVKEQENDLLDPMEDIGIETIPDKKSSKKDKKEKKEKKERKKGGFPIITVLVLLLIIGSIVALLFFNLLGFRETYIMPYVRNIPFIGAFFPEAEKAGEAAESSTLREGRYANASHDELVSIITALEYQVQMKEMDETSTREQIARMNETIDHLRGFEAQIGSYREIKQEFDRMIVNAEPDAYKKFFEDISPENAERLYQETINRSQFDDNFKRYAMTFSTMEASEAGNALKLLLSTNSELVVNIFNSMSVDSRAAIWDEMDDRDVARIARLMEPEQQIVAPLATAPPLPIPTPAPNTVTDEQINDNIIPEAEAEPVPIE